MKQTNRTLSVLAVLGMLATSFAFLPETVTGQGRPGGAPGGRPGGPGGPGGGPAGRGAAPSNLPSAPTAVALPTLSNEVTGPGQMYDSIPSLPPNGGLAQAKYEQKEYFVSGTAAGQPYRTRIVVRKPTDNGRFSGLVMVESMHGSGAAHMFEFTSIYAMASGHGAVEILTTSPAEMQKGNGERYKDLQITDAQRNEVFAQVGSLVRTGKLFGGAAVRKVVLSGTSQTAGFVLNYLPAHMVYRTPENGRIYDGFMPTSNGGNASDVDVPIIQLPTMHEVVAANITSRQDSDEAGKQFRLYEFSGIAHIDTRDSQRMKPNPCSLPLSEFPHQAFMAVGLNHLYNWVDKGVAPPKGERIWLDRDEGNDGSRMALDEHGNPRGGIRNTYVDVPTVKYSISPPAIRPAIPNGSPYIVQGGQQAADLMCRLSGAQTAFTPAKLRELYKSKRNYVSLVEKRLTELEKAGWSLPVYRDLIVADANKVNF